MAVTMTPDGMQAKLEDAGAGFLAFYAIRPAFKLVRQGFRKFEGTEIAFEICREIEVKKADGSAVRHYERAEGEHQYATLEEAKAGLRAMVGA